MRVSFQCFIGFTKHVLFHRAPGLPYISYIEALTSTCYLACIKLKKKLILHYQSIHDRWKYLLLVYFRFGSAGITWPSQGARTKQLQVDLSAGSACPEYSGGDN